MRSKSISQLKRRKNFKSTRVRFLIVCEGEKTEPNYFNSFRVPKCVVIGVGANTVSLVKKAIELKSKDSYEQVWCVFDRDSFPVQNFNNALALAKKNKIEVAYSNEAFELWYILHFHYHDAATSRDDYKQILSQRLGFTYQKNDPTMYDSLSSRQDDAIRNAARLLNFYVNRTPASDNPSTTVHILVQELNNHTI